MKKRVEVLREVVREAGEAVRDIRFSQIRNTKSGVLDLLTEGDLESERIIVDAIKKHFPEDKFLSEETAAEKGIKDFPGYLWVIDPIDGTANYARGRSYFGVSVGLTKGKELLAGAVYSPVVKELYFAEKGKGATLNGKAIQCSDVNEVEKAYLVTSSFSVDKSVMPEQLGYFFGLKPFGRILVTASAEMSLCEVAAGRLDLFLHTRYQPWDCAAGLIICQEAGAESSDLQGRKINMYSPEIVTANPRLLREFVGQIIR